MSNLESLSLFLRKFSSKLFPIILVSSLLSIFFYISKIPIAFDYTGLGERDQNVDHELLDFYKKENNILLVIVKSKKSSFSGEDLCRLKKTFNSPPRDLEIDDIDNPFKYSLPYQSGRKALFKGLIDLNCHNIQNKNYLNTLRSFEIFKDFSNESRNDLLFKFHFKNIEQTTQRANKLLSNVKLWLSKELGDDFSLYYGGSPMLMDYIHQILLSDGKINIYLMTIFLSLFYFFYRSLLPVLLYFSSLLIVTGFLLPLFYYFDVSINPLTASLFFILMIASIEDFIFLINDFKKSKKVESSIKKFIRPSLLTSMTTVIGFGSLLLSPIRDIRFFGLLTAIGAVLEWIILFFLIPGLLEKMRLPKTDDKLLSLFNNYSPCKVYAYVAIIPFVFAFFLIPTMRVDESMAEMFFSDHPYHKNNQYLGNSRGWQRRVFLIPTRPSFEKGKFDNYILKQKNISKVIDYQTYANEVTSSLDSYNGEDILKRMKASELYKKLHFKNRAIQIIFLKEATLNSNKDVVSEIDQFCQENGCQLFGRQVEYIRYSQNILDTLYKSFALSFSLVALALILISYFKLRRLNLWLIFSALWGPVIMILVFALFKIPLNLLSCIFFAVFIGIAGDNSIQYLFHQQGPHAKGLEELGKSSLIITFFTALGSLAITQSDFKFTAILGGVFALGFLINIYGDLYILKGSQK
jgi:uncharacterized protein